MMEYSRIIIALLLLTQLVCAADPGEEYTRMPKASTFEFVQFDANRIRNWIGNNGHTSSHIPTGNSACEWPQGSRQYAIFASGLWLVGMIDGEIRSAAAEFSSEWYPGHIIYDPASGMAGTPSDPSDALSQIYSIDEGDCADPSQDCYSWEYANWPASLGAPAHDGEFFEDIDGDGIWDSFEAFTDFNGDGVYTAPDGVFETGMDPPLEISDQVHWRVINDLDPSPHSNLWSTDPLGVEVQVTTFGFAESSPLDNVMFFRYLIINKGGNSIDSLYLGNWTDSDVGDANDDYVGCDTTLDLGFMYNGDVDDQDYGLQPPAVGYAIIQGPQIPAADSLGFFAGEAQENWMNRGMSAFMVFDGGSPWYSDPEYPVEAYNYLSGLMHDGELWHERRDPDEPITRYLYPGDPVTRRGWTCFDDRFPQDLRFLQSTGPFDLPPWTDGNLNGMPDPGEVGVQEVVLAVIITHGRDNIDAITNLRYTTRYVKQAWFNQFQTPVLPAPEFRTTALDQEIILNWARNDDVLLNWEEKGYRFEGYELFQGETPAGPWTTIGHWDLDNHVRALMARDYDLITGRLSSSLVHSGQDIGLEYHISLREDQLNGSELINNRLYHFAVRAYAAKPGAEPEYLDSELSVLSVRPNAGALGSSQTFTDESLIPHNQIGDAQLNFEVRVLDPGALTQRDYVVGFQHVTGEMQGTWFLGYYENGLITDTLYSSLFPLQERRSWWGWYWGQTQETGYIDGFDLKIENINWHYPVHVDRWEQTLNLEGTELDSVEFWAISPGGVDSLVWSDGPGSDTIHIDTLYGPNSYWDRPEWIDTPGGTIIKLTKELFHNVHIASFADDVGGENDLASSIPGIGGGVTDSLLLQSDLELRFTETGQKITAWAASDGFAGEIRQAPFELWDVERNIQLCMGSVDWNQTGTMYNDSSKTLESDWMVVFFRDYTSYQDSILPLFDNPHAGWLFMFSTSSKYTIGDELMIYLDNPVDPETDLLTFSGSFQTGIADDEELQAQLERISVFPNPYFGGHDDEFGTDRFITFAGLPERECIIRIFTLAGDLVARLDHGESISTGTPYEYWDLRNQEGRLVASGMYVVHIEIPGLGDKILKLAILQRGE